MKALRALPARVSEREYARLELLAKKSGLTLEKWLGSVIASAAACDEMHWREIAERDDLANSVDREMFGRLSVHLRSLPRGTVDSLCELIAATRIKGRVEGRADVLKLAALVARSGS